jgi:thiamine biosynthesis lipoprotein
MATVFEVRCVHEDAGYARQAAHAAFSIVDGLEQEMSRFIPNSDVSRINELRAGESTRVSPWTMECLEIARGLFDRTGGAFDVSIGSGLDGLELVPDAFTVKAHADGIRLDLGGIGKGYAVDRMADLLREWEVLRAVVHGGFSSVLALEPPPDREGWPLTLSAPWPGDERILARLSARRMALSASGTRKGDHIVDPRTGRSARGRAVWVALSLADGAETKQAASAEGLDGPGSPAAVVEGLSTAFMVKPVEEIAHLSRTCPGLETWITEEPTGGDPEGSALVHLSSSAKAKAALPEPQA